VQHIRRILVFRVGLLGDTLVALPSLHALRKNFPGARIALLHECSSAKHVQVEQLLDGSGLGDDHLTYPVLNRNRRQREGRIFECADRDYGRRTDQEARGGWSGGGTEAGWKALKRAIHAIVQ
jgi:hypothetical protein